MPIAARLFDRKLLALFVALGTLSAGIRVAEAQFVAPTCTPPDCNPSVIQNISVSGSPQTASYNISGDGKVGATFQAGANAPVLNAAGQNLLYGNVAGTSTAGSLLLLQLGAADRFRVGLTGDLTTQGVLSGPAGSVGAPTYTFNGDSNTGLYWSGTDSVGVSTNGVQRMSVNNGGVAVMNGPLFVPVGSVVSPSLAFAGDSNTGIYHPSADTIAFVTNGINTMTMTATNSVVVPGSFTTYGTFTAAALAGEGSNITNLNASNLGTGTVPAARLPSTLVYTNTANTFTGLNTFNNQVAIASPSTGLSIANSLGGVEIYGTGENAFNVYSDGTTYYRVDADNDSSNAWYWLNGDNSTIMSLNENGDVDIEGMTMFGGPGVRLLNPGENLIYGNVDQFAVGHILLLQAESVDRFSVDADGNVEAAGTISSGGNLVCLSNGVNCQSSVDGFGNVDRVAKFTVDGSVLGNSTIWDDGDGVAIGGAPTPGTTLSIYGTATANSFSAPIIQAINSGAGATAVLGYGSGAGSTGVTGDGVGYGVYGTSAGTGVYGRSTGTGAGVYGSSSSGYGGDFSSLRSTGLALFSGGAQVGNGTSLILGQSAADIGGTNGRMFYNTTTNKFRCYENGAWQDCRDGGIGGSGTVNAIPKFTAGTTLGNSNLTDNGSTVTLASPATTVPGLSIVGNSLSSGSGLSISSTAARGGSLLNLSDTGVTTSGSRMLNIESTNAGANSDALVRLRAAHGNTNRVMMYLSTDETTVSDPLGGVDKFLLYSSGSVDMKGHLTTWGNATFGNTAADTLTISGTAVSTPNNLNIDANTLYVDAANNRVGVGTAAPATTLAVGGTLAVTGNSTLGDANADRTTINGELVLGNQASNPTGVNGMMFYNSLNNKFRCFENGAWINCGAEEDTFDSVTTRGQVAYRNIAIDTDGGGTFMGGEALTIEAAGTGIYASGANYGVRGNASGASGIGIWGGGPLYGGYFGTSGSGGYAIRADAWSANNVAIYAQGRLQVTQGAGFGGAAPSASYGVQTQGNYGIVSYGQGANSANYGGYLYGSGASNANYGLAAYGIGGTSAYGVMGYAQGATNNYAFYASLGSMRTACSSSDSETDSIVCEDIAEVYETGEATEPGDVIVWRPDVDNKVYKSRKPYEEGIAGIYSTSPGVLMGNKDVNGNIGVEIGNSNTAETIKQLGSTHAAVALAGRVPVKVTLEGGPIKPGDLLTSSSTSGHAMKATTTGRVVCMAMESFDASDEDGKVMCYVNPHQWVNPEEYADLKSSLERLEADVKALKAGK